jgi:hypothetical protein
VRDRAGTAKLSHEQFVRVIVEVKQVSRSVTELYTGKHSRPNDAELCKCAHEHGCCCTCEAAAAS